MKLTLIKPENTAVKGSVVLMYERAEFEATGLKKKFKDAQGKEHVVKTKVTRKVGFGEVFEEDDQTAHEIIAAYEGLVVVHREPVVQRRAAQEAPQNKMVAPEGVK